MEESELAKRQRGRPPRQGRKLVKLSINIDKDLYDSVDNLAMFTSIPISRLINLMIRHQFESSIQTEGRSAPQSES